MHFFPKIVSWHLANRLRSRSRLSDTELPFLPFIFMLKLKIEKPSWKWTVSKDRQGVVVCWNVLLKITYESELQNFRLQNFLWATQSSTVRKWKNLWPYLIRFQLDFLSFYYSVTRCFCPSLGYGFITFVSFQERLQNQLHFFFFFPTLVCFLLDLYSEFSSTLGSLITGILNK